MVFLAWFVICELVCQQDYRLDLGLIFMHLVGMVKQPYEALCSLFLFVVTNIYRFGSFSLFTLPADTHGQHI